MLVKRGQTYGRTFPTLAGGEPPEPGELERYFDRHTEGPGIWKPRHYFGIYERHMAHLRGGDARLLEIGVFSGGSLQMWRHYLGPESHITGVDVVGPANPFSRFVDGLARNLDAGDPEHFANHEMRIAAEPFQRAIAGIHRYPFITVIERTAGPVSEFLTLRRGADWQPFCGWAV